MQHRPDNIAEPSNTFGNEKCAVANWTETYGMPPAWGWADTLCNQQFVPMCRMLRGWRVLVACYVLAACWLRAGCIGTSGLGQHAEQPPMPREAVMTYPSHAPTLT
jgi:hypothetical protein